MANLIVNSKTGRHVNFSNGVADPIYASILIEGSFLAATKWQKRLMIWLAEKNQNLVGSGLAPIEVTKLEWDENEFEPQKSFLLQIIKAAWVKKTYNQHGLRMGEDFANRFFPKILSLVTEIQFDDVESSNFHFYFEPPNQNFERCNKHGVYLNYFPVDSKERCLICSNEPAQLLDNKHPYQK